MTYSACTTCSRPLNRGNKSGICSRCRITPKRKRPYRENQATEAELDALIAERMATMPQGPKPARVK